MKYFRVKFGYGKDDFISIDETELSKAVRAQIKGTVAVFNEGSVAGNSILAIIPDFNRLKGWKRDYVLSGDDYEEIGSAQIQEHRNLIEEVRLSVNNQIEGRVNKLLS